MPQCPMGTTIYTIRAGDSLWLIARRFNTTVHAIMLTNPGINPGMLHIGQVLCIRPGYGVQPPGANPAAGGISDSELELSKHLRLLWSQHAIWTRLAIMGIVFSLPDGDLSAQRLLRNPKDFADALRPLYGNAIASRFSDLLTEHLEIAAKLVTAAKAGDSKTAEDAEKAWYANADELAAFLGSINPYWSAEDWRAMLHEHLSLVKAEAVYMLNKDYVGSVQIYDEIEQQILTMADEMVRGIVSQFPGQFTG